MLKLLTLFFTIFNNVFSIDSKFFAPKELYFDNEKTYEVISDCNDYILYKDSETYKQVTYFIEKDDMRITLEGEVIGFYQDSKIYVVTMIDEFVNLYVYTNTGTIISKDATKLVDGMIHKGKYGPILIGNIYKDKNNIDTPKSNVCIYDYVKNKYFIFGGDEEEHVTYSCVNENSIYLLINKDKISELPFGNQTTNILCRIKFLEEKTETQNFNYELQTIINIDEGASLRKIEYVDDLIYVFTSNSVLLFNQNLEYLKTKTIGEYNYGFASSNIIVIFNDNSCTIYDSASLIEYQKVKEDFTGVIRKLTNKFLCFKEEAYYFDIVDIRKLYVPKECYLSYECLECDSFFASCIFLEKDFETYFDKTLMGIYPFNIYFETKGGIVFYLPTSYEIKPKVNLTDKMVYESGYALSFNGDANVDGEYVNQQTRIYEEGLHHLIIEGKHATYELDFYISPKQISFIEKENKDGILIKENTPYKISFRIENTEDLEYKETILKGMVSAKTSFVDGILTIEIPKIPVDNDEQNMLFNDHILLVDKVVFNDCGKDVYVYIQKLYQFNLTKEDVKLTEDINKKQITYYADDENRQIRALQVDAYVNGNLKEYIFPLTNKNIKIDESTSSICHFYFLIDNGSGIYQKKYLFTSMQDGDMEITKFSVYNNDSYVEMRFDFENYNNNLIKLLKENNVLYENSNVNIQKTIVYFGIGIVLAACLGLLLKKLIYKKR